MGVTEALFWQNTVKYVQYAFMYFLISTLSFPNLTTCFCQNVKDNSV